MVQDKEQRVLHRPEMIFVLSGPGGVGKNTLADALCRRGRAVRAVTATTRAPRPGEEEGRDYFFVSEEQFARWRDEGVLLESNLYAGHWYGTPLFSVNRAAADDRPVLLVIDVNGALNVRRFNDHVTLIFVMPPSVEALERRLRARGHDDDERIRRRLQLARREMDMKHRYDHCVVNDDLETAVRETERIITTGGKDNV